MLNKVIDLVKSLCYSPVVNVPSIDDVCKLNYNDICNDKNINRKKRRNHYRLYKY